MRRKDKEITASAEIRAIIKRENVCRLAMSDNGTPYLVPLSYGYSQNSLYFHSASEGKKIGILKRNPRVCFEIERNLGVITDDLPCKWGMRFETVIGHGRVEFITEPDKIMRALNIITGQYGAPAVTEIGPKMVQKMAIFKVVITEVSGKRMGP
ncbi:MAG: pyridoxamine 5'-phosphate oxidase family protein [Thermodesulfobacteriota bacterium]